MTALERFEAIIEERARAAIEMKIEHEAQFYDRARHLPRVLGHGCLLMTDEEILAALERSVGMLSKALANGDGNGRFNRLLALKIALRAERAKCA